MTHTQPTTLQIADHLLNGEPYTIAPAAAAELRRLHAIEAALAQPTSGNYALGYADGFNDACKPAQPAQEPITVLTSTGYIADEDDDIQVYQRPWVGLTDREKSNLWLESRAAIPRFHTYASLVEAKLREKNT
jgi:hypothetical protein